MSTVSSINIRLPPPLPSPVPSQCELTQRTPLLVSLPTPLLPSSEQSGGFPPPPPFEFGKLREKSAAKLNKPEVIPKVSMKPLFWNRIIVLEDEKSNKKLWSDLEEPSLNFDEISAMFCKTIISKEKMTSVSNRRNSIVKQVAKILDPRRSQQIGILLSTLRMDISLLQSALDQMDTATLTPSRLKLIYEIKADPDELQKIKEHVIQSDTPLDKPEQFLRDLDDIPYCIERVSCMLLQSTFSESLDALSATLNSASLLMDELMSRQSVRQILGIILAIGNYMNGGNKQRGQADGFGLEILAKLKDVKSQDNQSLLQYVVKEYIRRYDDASLTETSSPLPDHGDVCLAEMMNFDEISSDLSQLEKDLNEYQSIATKVTDSCDSIWTLTFSEIMARFFAYGKQEICDHQDLLEDAKSKFQEMLDYFCVKPKAGQKDVSAGYFFHLWTSFTKDFRDFWRRERVLMNRLRLKESREKVKAAQCDMRKDAPQIQSMKSGGLKDKLSKKGLL